MPKKMNNILLHHDNAYLNAAVMMMGAMQQLWYEQPWPGNMCYYVFNSLKEAICSHRFTFDGEEDDDDADLELGTAKSFFSQVTRKLVEQ